MESHDTICALSSGSGRAALALIRISGPKSKQILCELSGRGDFQPRKAQHCVLSSKDSKPIDEVVAVFYESPNSFSGEDLVELSAHGNPVLIEQILDEIVSRGTRIAEPGEFTRRALANEKLSIDQVESLDWILNAKTKKAAQRGLHAKLKGIGLPIERARSEILRLSADIEAQLDFPEHEVGAVEDHSFAPRISELVEQFSGWCRAYESFKYELDSWVVALVGPPNSGKSSLFNFLTESSKAIVYDQPGTTRDSIEHELLVEDRPVLLIDTAGIREASEAVEKIGVERSLQAIERANLIVWVSSEGERPSEKLLAEYSDKNWLFVSSKSDLGRKNLDKEQINVSIFSRQGLEDLRQGILPPAIYDQSGSEAWLTSARQQDLVRDSVGLLEKAREDLQKGEPLEWVAQSVRDSSQRIGEVVGSIGQADLLKSILSRFCIGK